MVWGLFKNFKTELDLQNMHMLLRSIERGTDVMMIEFEKHVKKISIQVLTNTSHEPNTYVENVYGLILKFNSFVADVFDKDQNFQSLMEKV